MNQMSPPPKIEIIPASAPFSEAQRSWLNGFFAGLLTTDGPTPLSAEQGAAALQGPAGDGDDGEAPWHDQTMPIADRMKLAEGRPMRRRMMAAMAQQDCGQCGYNCNDYSEAIAGKAEPRLNLCVPGGKETARMLKALHEELEKAPAASPGPAPAPVAAAPAVTAEPGRSRDNPVAATFLSRRLLNKPGSEKETWHIDFDLSGCGLDYVVGNSFGIFARNELGHVDQIIALLGASHTTEVRGKTLREVLTSEVSLAPAPDSLFELLSFITGGAQREKARALAQGEDPDGDAETLDVMAALQKFSGVRPHPGSLCRGAGAAATAALFDLVVAQRDAGQAVADSRLRALRGRQAQALGRGLDLPRRAHQSRRRGQGLCAEGPRLRAAAGSEGADHHDRSRHRRRAVPRLPARPQGDRRAGEELAVLRPSAQRLRLLLFRRTERVEDRRAS